MRASAAASRRRGSRRAAPRAPGPAPPLALAHRLRFLGPVGLDVERTGTLAQLLVLADLGLGAERRRHPVAEGPLAAVAVGGTHVAVDHEAAVVAAQVR